MLGRTLSHYEILDTLGAGGMGEVYRARDTKLGREVAIKVLPEEFSRDRERLDRFEREAKLLAALNHPNVATLYGLEVSDGQPFLVMELVEGETLAERIARGNLPLDEAVSIFMQIADGLEAAHEKGIIHRDLKPANIKITPDGQVKILDFGLAKAFVQDDETDPSSSQSPTLTRGTALGTIMGTVAYMSPEQARAKQVDKRADIWAFGICLFEALSGTRPFEGDGATDILGSILKLDPNWDALPLELPSSVQRLLRRCLQKDARRRLRDIGDARHDLEERSNDTESGSPSIPNRARQVIPWILVAAMVGLLLRGTGPSPERATRRFPIDLPWQTVSNWGDFRVAISPDGTHLAYHGRHENRVEIYLRPLDSLEALPISGPVSPQSVAFSPDGKRLAFESAGELRTVSIQGGQPDSVLQVPEFVEGLSWGADDNILIGGTDGLSKVVGVWR